MMKLRADNDTRTSVDGIKNRDLDELEKDLIDKWLKTNQITIIENQEPDKNNLLRERFGVTKQRD